MKKVLIVLLPAFLCANDLMNDFKELAESTCVSQANNIKEDIDSKLTETRNINLESEYEKKYLELLKELEELKRDYQELKDLKKGDCGDCSELNACKESESKSISESNTEIKRSTIKTIPVNKMKTKKSKITNMYYIVERHYDCARYFSDIIFVQF